MNRPRHLSSDLTKPRPWTKDDGERRSIGRQAIEIQYANGSRLSENTYEVPQMRAGIERRVDGVLEGNPHEDGIFSRSAKLAFAKTGLLEKAMIRSAIVEVLRNKKDTHGEPLMHRDREGLYQTSPIPRGGAFTDDGVIRVRRGPFPSIPRTPADTEEVQDRARRGKLEFKFTPTKTMAAAVYKDGRWSEMYLMPPGSFDQDPTGDCYGQSIFGGNRVMKLIDGSIALFRPELHARRFADNARRYEMPCPREEELIKVYNDVAAANREYLPDAKHGSLYLRPALRSSGELLGLGPNDRYTFTCVAIPAGKIFQHPQKILLASDMKRGGLPEVKGGGNYAPIFMARSQARENGFDEIAHMDGGNVLELASSNLFFVTKEGVLLTPPLEGNILAGVTRDSVLAIAEELKKQGIIKEVRVGSVYWHWLHLARPRIGEEAFSTGTGVTINGIRSMKDPMQAGRLSFDTSKRGMGPVTRRIHDMFQKILRGEYRDHPRFKDWLVPVKT